MSVQQSQPSHVCGRGLAESAVRARRLAAVGGRDVGFLFSLLLEDVGWHDGALYAVEEGPTGYAGQNACGKTFLPKIVTIRECCTLKND